MPDNLTIRVAVACGGSNGPDLFFCRVRCTQQQYDDGLHYSAAMAKASGEGYEGPMVAIDQNDPAKAVMRLCVWSSIYDTVDISKPQTESEA